MSDAPPGPRNILLILTDQHTIRALSCLDWPGVSTPHLDRLAAEGLRFETSVCPAPVCGPARASFVNGLFPTQHGLRYNHDPAYADDDEHRKWSFADGLRQAGIAPYWIGKWHASEFYPETESRIHGFDYLPIVHDSNKAYGADVDDLVADRAEAFLASPPDHPFFLAVSLHNPHDICMWIGGTDHPGLQALSEGGDAPPLPANHTIPEGEPEFIRMGRQRDHYGAEMSRTPAWTEAEWQDYLRAYNRLVEHADRNIGRVLDALDEAGLSDDTLVVFTSDHGEGCAAHKMVVKLSLYEEVAGVPLLCRWPGRIPAGSVCRSHVASGVDLAPTFMDATGQPTPPDIAGDSFWPQLLDPECPGRASALVQLHPDPKRPELEARLLRTKDAAYMAFSHGDKRELLFDMRVDPGQLMDLSGSAAHGAERSAMRQAMQDWLSHTGDLFQPPD